MILYTIGYEKAGQGAVIDALRRAGVRLLIDVRELPLSRRAGFSKNTLAASLAQADIGYCHLKGLGTPKEGRQANRRGDMAAFWPIVDAALARPQAQHDLARAVAMAGETAACLLCLEADPHVCHRSRVAQAMAAVGGFQVTHLAADPAF